MPDVLALEVFDENEAKAAQLDHSRHLDVHRWSDHPEVNAFIDAVYAAHFDGRKVNVTKRHLKVLLLDLYLSWFEDSERYISIDRNPNAYKAGSRYNELHISRKTIDVVDVLVKAGMLDQAKGFLDRNTGIGRRTRIRPARPLVELFNEAAFSPFDIASSEDRLLVELRQEDPDSRTQTKIEYEPVEAIDKMSAILISRSAQRKSLLII